MRLLLHNTNGRRGMEPQKPTKAIRKDQVWSKRSIHLRSHIDSLGLKKTQRLDAHALVKVFFFRRSLRLKLTDTYLAKVWQMSLRNVQNRLQQLEQAGLIKRLTGKAKRTADGFRQDRRIVLLVGKKSQQLNLQAKPAVDNSTQRVKAKPKMPYVDYLSLQAKVSKGSFAFFLRQNNANPKTMGYLLSNIHQRIRNRPDTLESILFDAEAQKLKDSRLIGFMVNEIKARVQT
jgi:DNA-binding Lrp family transcriptional regulator